MDDFTQTVMLPVPLDQLKLVAVVAALKQTRGNVAAASRVLGVGRRSMHRWLKAWCPPPTVQAASGQPSPRPVRSSHRLTVDVADPHRKAGDR